MVQKSSDSRVLTTPAQVMEALGGIGPVAVLVGSTRKNVENFNRTETLPARYFLAMWLELVGLGYWASPGLWGQSLSRNQEVILMALARKAKARAAA